MKPDDLDTLLAREARRSLPSAPDLRAAVRTEIAQRRGRSIWTRLLPLLHWHELVLQPQFAAAALALALVAGALPGLAMRTFPSGRDDARRARASLHLGVFSLESASGSLLAPSPGKHS